MYILHYNDDRSVREYFGPYQSIPDVLAAMQSIEEQTDGANVCVEYDAFKLIGADTYFFLTDKGESIDSDYKLAKEAIAQSMQGADVECTQQ